MAEVLKFGPAKDSAETYADGTVMPHRESALMRQLPDGSYVQIGYVEIHAHKVSITAEDVEDVSVGVTVRVNPKR